MVLTQEEIRLILDKINNGKSGYSDDPVVFKLQGKLSIMLQMAVEGQQGIKEVNHE